MAVIKAKRRSNEIKGCVTFSFFFWLDRGISNSLKYFLLLLKFVSLKTVKKRIDLILHANRTYSTHAYLTKRNTHIYMLLFAYCILYISVQFLLLLFLLKSHSQIIIDASVSSFTFILWDQNSLRLLKTNRASGT